MVYQAANKGGYYAILGYPTWLVGCFSKVDVPGSNAWLPQGSATLDVTPEKTVFTASGSNPIYGASTTVQPPAVKVAALIKHD